LAFKGGWAEMKGKKKSGLLARFALQGPTTLTGGKQQVLICLFHTDKKITLFSFYCQWLQVGYTENRVRFPTGQKIYCRGRWLCHREKSSSRFAPNFFNVGLFAVAILCNNGRFG